MTLQASHPHLPSSCGYQCVLWVQPYLQLAVSGNLKFLKAMRALLGSERGGGGATVRQLCGGGGAQCANCAGGLCAGCTEGRGGGGAGTSCVAWQSDLSCLNYTLSALFQTSCSLQSTYLCTGSVRGLCLKVQKWTARWMLRILNFNVATEVEISIAAPFLRIATSKSDWC